MPGVEGHRSGDCPFQRVRCPNCSKFGHLAQALSPREREGTLSLVTERVPEQKGTYQLRNNSSEEEPQGSHTDCIGVLRDSDK